MGKPVRIQALSNRGKIVHEFPSIAAAVAAGHSGTTINKQLLHNGRSVDGLLWRRTTGPVPSIDRLALIATRLEAVARRLERKA